MNTSPRLPPDTDEGEAGSSDAELDTLVKGLRSDVSDVRDSFKRSLIVEWRRFQARVVEVIFRAGFGICVMAFGVTASMAGAVLISAGLYKAIVLWTEVEWIGGLGAGLGIVALAAGVAAAFRLLLQNKSLAKTKRALSRGVRP